MLRSTHVEPHAITFSRETHCSTLHNSHTHTNLDAEAHARRPSRRCRPPSFLPLPPAVLPVGNLSPVGPPRRLRPPSSPAADAAALVCACYRAFPPLTPTVLPAALPVVLPAPEPDTVILLAPEPDAAGVEAGPDRCHLCRRARASVRASPTAAFSRRL
jgi:hypothetical protein